jgi:hypothetical protein
LLPADPDIRLAEKTLHYFISIVVLNQHVFPAARIRTLNGEDHGRFSSICQMAPRSYPIVFSKQATRQEKSKV